MSVSSAAEDVGPSCRLELQAGTSQAAPVVAGSAAIVSPLCVVFHPICEMILRSNRAESGLDQVQECCEPAMHLIHGHYRCPGNTGLFIGLIFFFDVCRIVVYRWARGISS